MAKRALNAYDAASKAEADAKRAKFVEIMRSGRSIRAACDAVGVARQTFHSWKDRHPEFDEAVRQAFEDGTDRLEDEAFRRAHDGNERPVYQGGELVGTVTDYSDTLMTFMLRGRRPERYRENNNTNVNIVNMPEPSDRDLAKAMALLVEEKSKTIDG